MKRYHLQNGHVIDPANDVSEVKDLWIVDGKISYEAPGESVDETIDCRGRLIAPGFIDVHTHLREPGREDKETIASGTRAAAAGGFTTVCPAPNTDPVIDSQTGVRFIVSRAQADAVVHVCPIAAITCGLKGEQITEVGDLLNAGAIAFSNGMTPIMNNQVLRRALEYARMFDVLIMDHCEDEQLSEGGLVRTGPLSTRLGLKGWPSAAESIMVARDIELAEFTGGRIHIRHVSTEASVHIIKRAKRRGVRVTTEVTPHHLGLTVEAASTYDTNVKCNPPLPTERDRRALYIGLQDGTIDIITTDHAPHTEIEKDFMFTDAPFGVVGLETAFGVLNSTVVKDGVIPMEEVIAKMTINPARVLGLDKGTLGEGVEADLVILDPAKEWTVDANKFFSKGHNSPWLGQTLHGQPVATFVAGREVFREGQIVV